MNFEWDEEKNRANILKHGIDFADAPQVFESPMLTALDAREDYGEDRWIGVGFLREQVVIVVFTESDDTTRIVSLRKAQKHERTRFEEQLSDRLGEN